MNVEYIENDRRIAGYNLLVTSGANLTNREMHTSYHDLCKAEESFRIIKFGFNAGPFIRARNHHGVSLDLLPGCVAGQTFVIQGTRNRHCLKEIFRFLRDFRVAKISGQKYILSDGQIKKLSHMF